MAIEDKNGLKGSLGEVVFYTRKGTKCRRTKTQNFHDAKTPNQLKHREKMRRSSQFLRSCIKCINIGYQGTEKNSPSNEARSFIVKNCFTDTVKLPELDFSKVLISRGLINPPQNAEMTSDGSQISIIWKTPVKGNTDNKSDDLMVMMYSDNINFAITNFLKEVAKRADGTATAKIPPSTAPWHVWIFFSCASAATNESKSKISDSVYLGVI